MTAPRQLLPHSIYFVSRRCTQRQFLLRPDEKTTKIFLFCLGEAARRFGVHILAWHASSNHYHAVFYDPYGVLPAFLEHLHKMIAKVLNARWGRWENLWASEQTCVVRLVSVEDVFDKVVYTLANPVVDDLVDCVFDWPGANSLRHMGGGAVTVPRPRLYFREGGPIPEQVALTVKPPPQEDAGAWAERVRAAVRRKEQAARAARLASRSAIVGRRRIMSASAFDRPTTQEPRRNLRPHIACKSRERRILELRALRAFRAAHAAARELFVAGQRGVLFPFGTYKMRLLGARCAVAT